MERYVISQFDGSTFSVLDQYDHREICVCANIWGRDAEVLGRRKREGRKDCGPAGPNSRRNLRL